MTMPKQLTKLVERQITEDWQREIPSLGVYKPRHLLRRAGPLLMGICLERDSGGNKYKPVFHVHCLGKEASAVFLTLFTQLCSDHSGGPDYVQVRFHDEKYKEAAARMVRQARLPLANDLGLEQVIDAYRRYMATPMGALQAAALYRDMIILSAWVGDQSRALKLLAEGLRLPDAASFQHVGGRSGFEAVCRELVEQPTLIQQTVVSQIAAIGVGHVPVSSLFS